MSTLNQLPPHQSVLPPLVDGERLSRAEFHARYAAMPERTRAELVDGVVVMMAALRYEHGDIDGRLSLWVHSYRWRTPGLGSAGNATTGLGPRTEVQPDLLLRIREDHGGATQIVDGYLEGPPELVIEVAQSSRAYDLGVKKDTYHRAGVAEYLVVTLAPDQIQWFARDDRGQFAPIEPDADGVVRSRVFPGLWLDPSALFADDLDQLVATLEAGLATPDHADFVAELAARRTVA